MVRDRKALLRRYGYAYAFAGAIFGAAMLVRPPCPFLTFLHVPCPGCGMTRAAAALLRLDFSEAFTLHPMVWSLPLLPPFFFCGGKPTPWRTVNWACGSVLIFGFLATYIFRLLWGFPF